MTREKSMRAFVIKSPNHAEIVNLPLPEISGDMVRIKVVRSGICATDLAIFSGNCSFVRDGQIRYPVRIGHEYSGVVEAVGDEVAEFRPGDRVFSDCAVTCGHCPACREKRYGDCREVRSLGTVNTWDGCFAEYQDIPERHVHPLPDTVSYDDAALIEPAAVAYDAFRNVTLKLSDTVAVIGAGPIGMAAVWLAKNFGAGTIVMVGRNAEKLAIAQAVGADRIIDSTHADVPEELRKMTGGRGVDLMIEASGAEAALNTAIASTRVDGHISIISFYDKPLREFPIDNLVLQGLTLSGAAGRFGNAVKVCEMMRASPLKLTPVITHRIGFDDCLEFFVNEQKYHDHKIKAMVEFDK